MIDTDIEKRFIELTNEYKTVDFVEEEARRLVELSSKSEKFNISTLNGILEFRHE